MIKSEILRARLLRHLLGSYVTHVLHTARINNDERVLYNDTETLMGRLQSHLLGSYVTHVLHTARINNDERVLYNDKVRDTKGKATKSFTSLICDKRPTNC